MNIGEIYKIYPTKNDCISHLEKVKWGGKPICPYCKSDKSTPMPKERRYHCNTCKTSYSVTVGTIFHKTKVDLQVWFVAVSLVLNAKKGIAARQLSRDLGVNKDTAWYMAMRIRRAMIEQGTLMEGIIEMDETYIGGKPRKGVVNNPSDNHDGNKRGRGTKKVPVVGMVQRGGNVKAKMVKRTDHKTLSRMVRESIAPEKSRVFTDEYKGYVTLKTFVQHKSVNHQYEYVNGEIHTNTIEGFWALLKRGIIGQYHKVSARHLNKYLNEFCFRYNNRKNTAAFQLTIARALGVAQ